MPPSSSRADARPLPSQGQLLLPLLETLSAHGGDASPSVVADALADRFALTEEQRTAQVNIQSTGGTTSAWGRHVRWVRERAKTLGFVTSTSRALWSLTPAGKAGLRNASAGVVITIYETAEGEAIYAKCEDALRVLTPSHYSLLVSSPPFPELRKDYEGQLDERAWHAWMMDVLGAAYDVLAPNSTLVLNLGPRYLKGVPHHSLYRERLYLALAEHTRFVPAQEFVFSNPSKLPSPAQWCTVLKVRAKSTLEHCMAFVKGDPKWDTASLKVPYSAAMQARLAAGGESRTRVKPSGHALKEGAFSTDNGGSLPSDLLTFSNAVSNDAYQRHCRAHGLPIHPARFPEGLAEFFIKLTTKPGDSVLDIFGGRSTVGVVAERLGRRWTTVERSLTYIGGGAGVFLDRPNFRAHVDLPGVGA